MFLTSLQKVPNFCAIKVETIYPPFFLFFMCVPTGLTGLNLILMYFERLHIIFIKILLDFFRNEGTVVSVSYYSNNFLGLRRQMDSSIFNFVGKLLFFIT